MLSIILVLISLLLFMTNSSFMWWSLFLITTFIAMYKIKMGGGSPRSLLLYFVVQEFSILFVVLCSYLPMQGMILLISSGVSPFHSWVLKVMSGMSTISFIWMNTFQKMPYYMVLSFTLSETLSILILGFSMVPLMQALGSSGGLYTLILLLVGSSNLSVVMVYYETSSLFFLILYLIFLNYTMGWVGGFFSLELWSLLVSLPFTLPLLMKLMVLLSFSSGSSLFLLLLLMTLSLSLLNSVIMFFRMGNLAYIGGFMHLSFFTIFMVNLLLLI